MRRLLLASSLVFAACVTTPTLPTEPDPEWPGTYTDGVTTLDVQVFGKTGRPPSEFQVRFFHLAQPRADKATCTGDGVIGPTVELPCPTAADLPQCPRRIRLERVNGGFVVSFSGAGWIEQECTLQEIQPMPKPVTLARGDAFKSVVTPYVDALNEPTLLTSLGEDATTTAAQLAQQLKAEFDRQKLSSARATTTAALVTLAQFHRLALEACDGALTGCEARRLTTAVANAVAAHRQRVDALQAELDAK